MPIVSEFNRSTVHTLPSGWKKEEVVRKSGLSAGKVDIYYLSPDGRRARSKPQLSKLLGDNYDLSSFDFRSGFFNNSNNLKYVIPLQSNTPSDVAILIPIRQTASIFKQPVSIYRNHIDSKTRTDLKHGIQDPPKQLFWMKRLEGLEPGCNTDEFLPKEINSMELPSTIQGPSCNIVGTIGILQSIAAALHVSNQPITGQTYSNNLILKNPTVNINAEQPLIQTSIISDMDISKQELKVNEMRNHLAQAINNLNNTQSQ